MQDSTDGAIARFYNPEEWRNLCRGLFNIDKLIITGQKCDLLLLPYGKIKNIIQNSLPNSFTRFLTNDFRMGSFLIAQMHRI